MHQNFTYTDLIDRYLKGKLSDRERLAFEEKMQQDPMLAGETDWQRDIHQALGETRRAALKHRLDQVPVNTSPWASWSGGKLAAAVGTVLLVGASTYYYTSQVDQTVVESETLVVAPRVAYPQAYTLRHTAVPKVAEEPTTQKEAITKAETSPAAEATRQNRPEETAYAKPPVAKPTIVRPEVVSEFAEDTPAVDYRDFQAPVKQTLQGNAYQEEEVAIEAFSDSNYGFHYQFYDHKLFLHGDFDGYPYKVIALNTEDRKKLFLEFKSAYYRISEQSEVAPLVAIEDEALVKSLRALSQID